MYNSTQYRNETFRNWHQHTVQCTRLCMYGHISLLLYQHLHGSVSWHGVSWYVWFQLHSFCSCSSASALHLAIIHNHQDVVLQLLDVLPQLPPTETPVVDCLNNLKQVGTHTHTHTHTQTHTDGCLTCNHKLVCSEHCQVLSLS